jgi:hypothetical protein
MTTALAVLLAPLPSNASKTSEAVETEASDFEFLERGSYTDGSGLRIKYAIWQESGHVGGDVSIYDPATHDHMEMWIRGDYVIFEGVTDGEPTSGAEHGSVLYNDPSKPACGGWVALVCIGVGILASSCAFGWSACTDDSETNVPGGQGGDPGGSGSGDGGGGDTED